MEKIFDGLIFEWVDGRAYHLEISPKDVAEYIVSAGSPGRIEILSRYLEGAEIHRPRRGLTWVKGRYRGIDVFGYTSGMGPSSMAITTLEVLKMLIDRHRVGYIIRIGTSGPLQGYVKPFSIIVGDSVVRDEATSSKVIYPEYPATLDPVIYLSAIKAGMENGYKYGLDIFLGKIQSKDDLYFYEGFHNSPIGGEHRLRFKAWRDIGVLASEMEASILPILRDYLQSRFRGRGIRLYVGTILATLKSPMDMESLKEVEARLCKLVLDTFLTINEFRRGRVSLDDILRTI